jgi:4-amino-4-deoxy-L-arabinose transferase-like glycosyltransferase
VPWTVFSLCAVFETATIWIKEKRTLLKAEGAWNVFLLIWLVIPIVFFSISQSKLPGYILPAIPAGALLLADYVQRKIQNDNPFCNAPLIALHSVLAALPVAPAFMLGVIMQQHQMPWNRVTAVSFGVVAGLAIAIMLTLRGKLGLRGLRVSLLPVVLAIAIVLRIASPSLDNSLSVRPLDNAIGHRSLPLAIFHVGREIEYGLSFYRNARIDRYENGRIPSTEHMLVAPTGSLEQIQNQLPERRILYVGNFASRNLDYFWVAAVNLPQ